MSAGTGRLPPLRMGYAARTRGIGARGVKLPQTPSCPAMGGRMKAGQAAAFRLACGRGVPGGWGRGDKTVSAPARGRGGCSEYAACPVDGKRKGGLLFRIDFFLREMAGLDQYLVDVFSGHDFAVDEECVDFVRPVVDEL